MRVPGLGRPILRLAGGLLVIGLVAWGGLVRAQTPAPAAEPTQPNEPPTAGNICRTVEQAAAQNELPVEFFARVIWQESRFNAAAVSPKGAEGIAQFMPQTADFRGLADPFNPLTALHHAASYLNELRNRFGNLGLAAASYNAGPGRVSAWLGGQRDLPSETRNYVAVITGWTADEWASPSPPKTAETTIPQGVPCARLANLVLAKPQEAQRIATRVPVWGAQLASFAADVSERTAWAIYRTVQKRYAALVGDREPILLRDRIPGMGTVQRYVMRIAADNRDDLERLCSKIIMSGGGCAVLRNRPAVQVVNVN
jgi:Transglycosylase SLT domain